MMRLLVGLMLLPAIIAALCWALPRLVRWPEGEGYQPSSEPLNPKPPDGSGSAVSQASTDVIVIVVDGWR
jgi:hypothetical protein